MSYIIIPQTKEEKIKMYMALTKRQLSKMLYNANELIDSFIEKEACPNCTNGWNIDHSWLFGGSRKCITCGGTGKISGKKFMDLSNANVFKNKSML